jgi:CubicO group peptidase (beta-lactamase class C family)
LAEIIERVAGENYCDAIERRITRPLGLGRLLGVPLSDPGPFALPVDLGAPRSDEELRAFYTGPEPPLGLQTYTLGAKTMEWLRSPAWRAAGVPGGGAMMTAADLALLFQAFLHNPGGLWEPGVLQDGTRTVRTTPDQIFKWWGIPVNRTRGFFVAGDDGHSGDRNLGRASSSEVFGQTGAVGQFSIANPDTGVSVAYCTSGLDADDIRVHERLLDLCDLGLACAES